MSRYQKGKTNLDFTEARDSEWQWHPLGHMQVCTSLQTDNHASIPPLTVLQAGCPSCCPTNSAKALKALTSMRGNAVSAQQCHCDHSQRVCCARRRHSVPLLHVDQQFTRACVFASYHWCYSSILSCQDVC